MYTLKHPNLHPDYETRILPSLMLLHKLPPQPSAPGGKDKRKKQNKTKMVWHGVPIRLDSDALMNKVL